MHPIVQELHSIVEKGAGLLADFESNTFRLQQWLAEREAVFSRLKSAAAELAESDRQTVVALSEEILALDGTILPRLEARLHATGKEIVATRKLKQVIGNAAHSESSLLRRGI
jgi:hypothetical protein